MNRLIRSISITWQFTFNWTARFFHPNFPLPPWLQQDKQVHFLGGAYLFWLFQCQVTPHREIALLLSVLATILWDVKDGFRKEIGCDPGDIIGGILGGVSGWIVAG